MGLVMKEKVELLNNPTIRWNMVQFRRVLTQAVKVEEELLHSQAGREHAGVEAKKPWTRKYPAKVAFAVQPTAGEESGNEAESESEREPEGVNAFSPRRNPATGPSTGPRTPRCIFCSKEHWAGQCEVYSTLNQRRRRLKDLNRCWKCHGVGHNAKECPHDIILSCEDNHRL
jgi:hypothetical protein